MRADLTPPSGGTPPPATATLPSGSILHLSPLAHQISERFQAEYPDDNPETAKAAFAWCVHDNQWLLAWAAEDLTIGRGHFTKQLRWLAGILRARNYPLERLVRDLELAAEVIGSNDAERAALADRFRTGATALAATSLAPTREREPR